MQSMRDCFPRSSFFSRAFLSIQRQPTQILSIQKQQIERKEHTFAPLKQQVIEHRPAHVIDTCDLAIHNSILNMQMFADPLREVLEVAERVSVAGHEFTWPFSI